MLHSHSSNAPKSKMPKLKFGVTLGRIRETPSAFEVSRPPDPGSCRLGCFIYPQSHTAHPSLHLLSSSSSYVIAVYTSYQLISCSWCSHSSILFLEARLSFQSVQHQLSTFIGSDNQPRYRSRSRRKHHLHSPKFKQIFTTSFCQSSLCHP